MVTPSNNKIENERERFDVKNAHTTHRHAAHPVSVLIVRPEKGDTSSVVTKERDNASTRYVANKGKCYTPYVRCQCNAKHMGYTGTALYEKQNMHRRPMRRFGGKTAPWKP